ncbi:UDP-2,3-diacylglucosamine diphosphatase [Neptunomonas antarctica]|uniref:UDP-2,3-diacylglucosamine hydrolase n=1 Tax=Neptunomonas antarctica TaxID=619304 RepID=A0A1N7NFA9_9GAMM|nr:UDP-2,3-diacylglucosamine diphosphatase [Neptunomonas antarctica]SIS97065.1 UDP-2,3-diacylglucosamine hydrolase [Neptunomonas antarctica]
MKVLFISDLHLKAERPDITRAFLHFLTDTARSANALYLLGDIFEAWIGDDAPVPEFEPICAALKTLSDQGCMLYFQHGNRDFLVGDSFLQKIGATLLDEKQLIDLPIGPALLMHGDQLCTDDKEYQDFRSMVRNPAWQQAFLSKPINERLAIARQLRATSQQRATEKTDEIMDVNAVAVATALSESKVELMIHGHTHRPAIHYAQLNATHGTRVVLGDWDTSLWYLSCDENGLTLVDEAIG